MRRGPRDLELYGKARALRHAGASYKVIAAELKISPASAHTWTSDIELTDEQREKNRRKPQGSPPSRGLHALLGGGSEEP